MQTSSLLKSSAVTAFGIGFIFLGSLIALVGIGIGYWHKYSSCITNFELN